MNQSNSDRCGSGGHSVSDLYGFVRLGDDTTEAATLLSYGTYEGNDNYFYPSQPYFDTPGISIISDKGLQINFFWINPAYLFDYLFPGQSEVRHSPTELGVVTIGCS